jgi:tetratricopeptide (TPR) repeat protein
MLPSFPSDVRPPSGPGWLSLERRLDVDMRRSPARGGSAVEAFATCTVEGPDAPSPQPADRVHGRAALAAVAFQRIGWGPIDNGKQDFGTDLFVLVFDERGEQLGLMVGAQVKTGATGAFAEPKRDHGNVVGWWFRDDDRSHIDDWLRHSVPHVIVLCDEKSEVCYWAHVTPERVVPAGAKGARIFVPSDQTIDLEHREALLEIAGANRPGVAWEGSAWTGAADLLPRDRLRHALVTPRLIAPHPNAGKNDPIDADEAVALMVLARRHDLDRFADEHDEVPELHAVPEDAAWRWRFAAALRRRMVLDESEDLIARVADAPTPADRAAATVAAATSLIEVARVADALELLDAAIERDEAEAVHHAWLLVQRARTRAEVGRIADAQDDALRAQGVRLAAPGDATASAIAASAAILLFNTANWEEADEEDEDVATRDEEDEDVATRDGKDVATLAISADTAASWWRSQITNSGLWGIAERSFAAWVEREPTTHADGFPGHNKLIAAAVMASHAGEQSSWRSLISGVAKSDILAFDRHADPKEVAAALEQLRLPGDHKPLRDTVLRVVADGPAEAAAAAALAVDLDASTRTTVYADLALLGAAGDVLDRQVATRMVGVLLAAITEPERLEARTVPGYQLSAPILDALIGVIAAADVSAQRAVAEHVLGLPAVEDYGVARAWIRLVRALPKGVWSLDDAGRLRDTQRHDQRLHMALLALADQLGDAAAHGALVDALREGSFGALEVAADLTSVPDDALTGLLRGHRQRDGASAGRTDDGDRDGLHRASVARPAQPHTT